MRIHYFFPGIKNQHEHNQKPVFAFKVTIFKLKHLNTYAISQLAVFSGIKAHTIRIWEKRYQALHPERTEGNTRYYNDHQLKRLLNIVSLANSGYSTQELCCMPDKKLAELIQQYYLNKKEADTSHYVSQLINAGLSYQEQRFQQLFARCLKQYGMEGAYKQVIYPMLQRVGLMWAAETLYPAQEHFITHLIRQKMAAAIDQLPVPANENECWLLFLPEDEFHETGLLFSQYLLRQAGKKVIYLGSNVPETTLYAAIKAVQPSYLLFFMVHRNLPEQTQSYLKNLRKHCKINSHIYACGHTAQFKQLKAPQATSFLSSAEDFEKILNN